jgi:hypothetical protein
MKFRFTEFEKNVKDRSGKQDNSIQVVAPEVI